MHIMYRNSTIDQEMILVKKAAETTGIEYDENNGGLMLAQKSTIKDKNNRNPDKSRRAYDDRGYMFHFKSLRLWQKL